MITASRTTTLPLPTSAPMRNVLPAAEPPKGGAEPTPPRDGVPTGAGGRLGQNEFLKLLVAQMNNQDPLNPMDGQQLAAQMAQFSTVEQLLQMNEKLDAQAETDGQLLEAIDKLGEQQATDAESMLAAIESTMALGAVGKIGVIAGDRLFVDGQGRGVATFDAGATASRGGKLRILDAKGELVAERTLGPIAPGMQSLDLSTFDPKLDLPQGEYRFAVDLQDDKGAFKPAKIFTSGRITGLTATPQGPQLLIGDRLTVPFSRLLQVRT
jgi:flagellar basal-body rod modification protein FlgD